MNFKKLHQQEDPILICNVWDVASAQAAQQLGFKAIGTSSGAIAAMLGYPDGEAISFDELEYVVSRITKTTNLPLTVDLEAGYSRHPTEIVAYIQRLEQLGVVGVNIEDSLVNGVRTILPMNTFAKTLSSIATQLVQHKSTIFLNVRTDTFLLGLSHPIEATLERASRYTTAGANGLFVPCIETEAAIKALVEQLDLPLNVMCMPKLPNFERLKNLGVKRISMGNFIYNKLSEVLFKELKTIQTKGAFQHLFQ